MRVNLQVYFKSKQSTRKENSLCKYEKKSSIKTEVAICNNRSGNMKEDGLFDQSRKYFTGFRINIHATQYLYFHATLSEIQNDRF